MAQKLVPAFLEPEAERRSGIFRVLEEPLKRCDFESLRASAAFSPHPDERMRSLFGLHDMDSLAFVAESSPYGDSRKAALEGLGHRISSFTPQVVRHLAESSSSPAIRSCASSLLR